MRRPVQDAGADKAVKMKRRALITWLGGVALSSPFLVRAGRAQQTLPVIGFLSSGSPTRDDPIFDAFQQGLATTGLVVGRDVNLEFRIGTHEQFLEHAEELVRRKVAVLVLAGTMPPPRLAVSAAASSIPIVFASAIDPVEAGVVISLSRPGGSVTGVATLNVELAAKRLELLRELLPHAATVALMVNPENAPMTRAYTDRTQAAAAALTLEVKVLQASAASDIDAAFAVFARERPDALVITPDTFFNSRIVQLASLALRHKMPAIYHFRSFAAAGGLIAMGGSLTEAYMQVGIYTGRIIKGEKPADLPVVQATTVELVFNQKTAKALGLAVPPRFLVRADEVIE
jgi:putative ABC transport system substrate-binding protein